MLGCVALQRQCLAIMCCLTAILCCLTVVLCCAVLYNGCVTVTGPVGVSEGGALASPAARGGHRRGQGASLSGLSACQRVYGLFAFLFVCLRPHAVCTACFFSLSLCLSLSLSGEGSGGGHLAHAPAPQRGQSVQCDTVRHSAPLLPSPPLLLSLTSHPFPHLTHLLCSAVLCSQVGSYALMRDSGFAQTDFLQCCKFAEGDSRILLQKMAR